MKLAFSFVIISTALVLTPARALAQAAAAPPPRDVLAELLDEVRGLRQAMERAATVGARIQLLVARVQLQEQRIAESARRVAAVRDELSKIDTQAAGVLLQAAQFESMIEKVPRDEREGMQRMIDSFKTQNASFEKRRQDLANEEALLLQQVSADQGRWSDVNGQLDDIERSLSTPPVKKP